MSAPQRKMLLKRSTVRALEDPCYIALVCLVLVIYVLVPSGVRGDPISGPILSDTTWSGTVEVEGDIVVQCGAVLTILPGTVVLFAVKSSSYDDSLGIDGLCDLIVLGAMTAVGGPDPSDSIAFDSDTSLGAPGQWGKVRIMPVAIDSLCQYRYLSVRHGTVGLEVGGGQITLEHSRFSENSSYGLVWYNPTFPVIFDDMTFEDNGADGFRLSGADSLNFTDCQFRGNDSTGALVTGNTGISIDSCNFLENGTAFSASITRLVSITNCSISGSGTAVSVSSSDSSGGLHLEGCSVSGEVSVEGCGTAEVIDNPSLGSVYLRATDQTRPLRSWVLRNSVEGSIDIVSFNPVDGTSIPGNIAVVRGNTVSKISLQAHGYQHHSYPNCYVEAEVDSNEVTGSGGIYVQAGARYSSGASSWCSPGSIVGSVRWNRIVEADVGLNLQEGNNYSIWCGDVSLSSSDNMISGCGTGIRVFGPDVTLSAMRDTVMGCDRGITSTGGILSVENCMLIGAATCDWAVAVSSADSVKINYSFLDNWTNGVSLSSCEWSEIHQNEIQGHQDGYGIKCLASSPLIQDNYIDRFLTAIHCGSGTNPVITSTSLACAPNWGINNLSSDVVVDATNKWWGDETGPYHPTENPSGEGSPISDNVIFSPWLVDYPNRPPLPFSLLFPENGAVVAIPTLDWEDATDPDCHDVLTYTLYIAEDSTHTAPMVVQGIGQSQYQLPESLLVDDVQYFWKVNVTDGDTMIWCKELDWSFKIDLNVFIRGDYNADGIVDTLDMLNLLKWLSGGGNPPSCLDAADVDDNGVVEIGDSTYIELFLQGSGFPPPPPYPDCGPDPTPDDTLDCEEHHYCDSILVGIQPHEADPTLPKAFALSQNYPNPFNPITHVEYALPKDCWVRMDVYNILGQRVASLANGKQKVGYKIIRWDASSLSSGIYFYRLQAGNFVQTRKMVLLK